MPKFKSVDDYISSFPQDVQAKLKQIRRLTAKLAPEAEEALSYGVAAFKLNGKPLIYYAAFKNHIGVYPYPADVPEFKAAASKYKTSTGTIRFPLDEPLPVDLIEKFVKYKQKIILKS